jgi:hypothetical protein
MMGRVICGLGWKGSECRFMSMGYEVMTGHVDHGC